MLSKVKKTPNVFYCHLCKRLKISSSYQKVSQQQSIIRLYQNLSYSFKISPKPIFQKGHLAAPALPPRCPRTTRATGAAAPAAPVPPAPLKMADTRACLSLAESIIKSKSSSEGNKKKRLFEIRSSLITESNRRTNVVVKNVIFRDELHNWTSRQPGI